MEEVQTIVDGAAVVADYENFILVGLCVKAAILKKICGICG
jgi:hypothetical protein